MMTRISAFALASILGLAVLPANAEKVGNVGAVNVSAHGTPPGGGRRPLSVGLGVEKRERIDTSAEGTAQVVFNDASTMTVGRNSSIVIDDFVYRGGVGSQGVSIAKGVMRFVGGGVSHDSGANLRTPTASIGVRGGAALVRVGGDCGTLVVHQYGKIDVSGGGNSQTLMRSGFGVCAPAGGPVSEPFRVPPEMVAAMTAQMASKGQQRGGAVVTPTNQEANLALGEDRPPSVMPPPGLDALTPFWVGGALAQSQANVQNQTITPTPSPTIEKPPEGGGEGGGGWGGFPGPGPGL